MKTKSDWRNFTRFIFAKVASSLGHPGSRTLAFALSFPKPTARYAWRKPVGDEHGPAAVRVLGMKTIARTLLTLTLLTASLWATSASSRAGALVYSQFSDNQSTYGPSQLWTATGVNSEVADEFNVVANIDRVSAGGFVWGR